VFWHDRHQPSLTSLRLRRQGQHARVIALADGAMQRLHRRFHRLVAKGKPQPKVAVAIAREFAGFVWAALRQTA
jgi:transposase